MRSLLILLCILSFPLSAIEVSDDAGNSIQLDKPAQRIISLAPHVTELLFEAGAGKQVIGVVNYSNYPEAAKQLPLVGGYGKLDIERIVSMKPDLIIGWQTGNQQAEIQQLKALGYKVFLTEPRHLPDIAKLLQRIGRLAGTEQVAMRAVHRFNREYQKLQDQYSGKKPLRAFYQIWDQPLMTINGKHLISDVMQLCGLQNVFADVGTLVPRISLESVIKQDPQIIITGGMAMVRPDWVKQWQRWPDLSATRLQALYDIHPDIIQRHTPRILLGARELCQRAEQVRHRLAQ